jgi:hypothetical protein
MHGVWGLVAEGDWAEANWFGGMQATVNAARATVDDSGRGLEASNSSALRLLNHSHRLAYSSFAPILGEHLIFEGPFQPPFPSTFHMQLASLSSFAQCVPLLLKRDS